MFKALTFSTPIGILLLRISSGSLIFCKWKDSVDYAFEEIKRENLSDPDKEVYDKTISELKDYFSGKLKTFSLNLNIELKGSPFQQKVWSEIKGIGYGETVTYGEIAEKIGNPKACRAVANACGKNPLALIVPCHRVVGSTGPGGYTGDIDKKIFLLQNEKNNR